MFKYVLAAMMVMGTVAFADEPGGATPPKETGAPADMSGMPTDTGAAMKNDKAMPTGKAASGKKNPKKKKKAGAGAAGSNP